MAKARTSSLRTRRAIHQTRADGATARRAAERVGSPITSLTSLSAAQINPTLIEESA